MRRDMESFDRQHAQALQRIWFLGDVHGQFKQIAQALIDAPLKPHQHDDRSDEYAKVRDTLGFDARAVAFCAIKNGLGEVIAPRPADGSNQQTS